MVVVPLLEVAASQGLQAAAGTGKEKEQIFPQSLQKEHVSC